MLISFIILIMIDLYKDNHVSAYVSKPFLLKKKNHLWNFSLVGIIMYST